ncbi:hypothetical protein LSAT2_028536 [Lamellibrachia satsuma]|nr:hypothetical protein LSAT2_028536 [Lamellibrachia satsuma]
MWCPIHTFSEDLNEGRDVAAGAFTGTLFQSLLGVGEKECRVDPPMISRMFPDTTWQLCKRHFCACALFPLPLFSQSR